MVSGSQAIKTQIFTLETILTLNGTFARTELASRTQHRLDLGYINLSSLFRLWLEGAEQCPWEMIAGSKTAVPGRLEAYRALIQLGFVARTASLGSRSLKRHRPQFPAGGGH